MCIDVAYQKLKNQLILHDHLSTSVGTQIYIHTSIVFGTQIMVSNKILR